MGKMAPFYVCIKKLSIKRSYNGEAEATNWNPIGWNLSEISCKIKTTRER